ncbi:hypothetical protein [Azospira restricta]|uniref:Uncharacterized protein n=1 Tax=Azospira restricta TaxID=404405 RepID=A0A974SNP1_9RHOO|nr:hypothetical protein [Azospira restricta]QRJ63629.1 hypothetical protein IWH25_18125 [Azospira restricta]
MIASKFEAREDRPQLQFRHFGWHRVAGWWPPVCAWLLYILHASLYRNWLVDDAGISFAYARNLAAGFGLVSQSGVPPVEGFSNPAWTFGLALAELFGCFDPVWTPKLISIALILCAFLSLHGLIRYMLSENAPVFSFAVLACCSANPSFVIWTTSGLENPLYATLICSLLFLCVLASEEETPSSLAIMAGALSALITLTRPDGVVYSVLFPAALLFGPACSLRIRSQQFSAYLFPLSMLVGAYLWFRTTYFGEWLPNTYYAKPGSNAYRIVEEGAFGILRTLADLLANSAFPVGSDVALLVLAGFPLLMLGRSRLVEAKSLAIIFFFIAAGLAAYEVLPRDWMGEYRFATPLFPLLYLFVFMVLAALFRVWFAGGDFIHKALPASVVLVFLSGASGNFVFRIDRFLAAPTVPIEDVAKNYADRFNAYAEFLGLEEASLGAPDIGGALMYSRLRIVDLAGLCDRRIGRLIHRDKTALRRYLLEEARPTFIHVHGPWAIAFDLYADPGFSEQYMIIDEEAGPSVSGVRQIRAGSYVRKDALSQAALYRVSRLSQLKIEAARTLYPRHPRNVTGI